MHLPSLPGLLVAMIAGLLLVGAKRLPEIGASFGHGIREFKKSLQEIQDTVDVESPARGPNAPNDRRSADPVSPARTEPRRLPSPAVSEGDRKTS